MEELEREAEQHLQEVTAQLREAQKEADGDLWEQEVGMRVRGVSRVVQTLTKLPPPPSADSNT